jgi:hypothetical protein
MYMYIITNSSLDLKMGEFLFSSAKVWTYSAAIICNIDTFVIDFPNCSKYLLFLYFLSFLTKKTLAVRY